MTTRPELRLGRHLLPGLAAVGLFVVLAAAVLAAPLGEAAGFPDEGPLEEANLTAELADGGSLPDADGSYETSVDGERTRVTVTVDGEPTEHNLTAADVRGERTGDVTSAVVSVPVDDERVTLTRVPLVDHANASIGPGAQVVAEDRPAASGGPGLYAVARRGSITESIGYAMFDLRSIQPLPAESFLVGFVLIAVVLDAALEAAVHLARRGSDEEVLTALEAEDDAGEGTGDEATDRGGDP